jgi:hypothetical protein
MFFDVIKHSTIMKKLKLSLSMFALLAGMGLAFTSASHAKTHATKFSTSWFTYSGTGSITDAANYTEVTGEPTCPSGSSSVCRIQATVGSGSKPVITTSLSNEITVDVNTTHTGSTNVALRDF